ncbi:hypothetical protein Sste5346_004713 [Sporothrix stenoceras]|uniref:Uncharacterized protein n=1 Tax=Sporothrix stenoceras TaxID=5173 RepID=A0ABR3Z9Y4_9PEZI
MAHFAFTPDTVESTSTPASDAPSASSPITPRDTHPGYSPGAIYSRSTGQPSPSARSIHSLHSAAETSSGKRRLGLLEYPTTHEDLQFCRDARERFKVLVRDNPSATPVDLEQAALSSLDQLRTIFDDMCHIPPPECVFYQWSYRQSHGADAETSGADVFHLLNSHCYMFDFDPQDNNTAFPIPDRDQVMAVLSLVGCHLTSLMLAFGLRRGLRRTSTEGREIFWMIYNTLMDLASNVFEDFLRAQPFLDRSVQLMSTVRAQRGATGALAYSGVFPTRAEVSYAMEIYATETRQAAEKAGAGLSPAATEASPLSFAMHRLDRLFQGIQSPAENSVATEQPQPQPQQFLEPSPMLLAQNFVGVSEPVYPVNTFPLSAPPHPSQQQSSARTNQDDADVQEDHMNPTNAPMMTARILRRPPTTCPAFTPVEVTIRPYSPYPMCDTPSSVNGPVLPDGGVPLESTTVDDTRPSGLHTSSPQPVSEADKDAPQPPTPPANSVGTTLEEPTANLGQQQAQRRVPPLAAINCNDVTELLQEENVLHEKFIDFVARFHDNVSETGARSLEKLVLQHLDLVYHRQQQQCRRELAARLRVYRRTPYYSHDQQQSTSNDTNRSTILGGLHQTSRRSTTTCNQDGTVDSRHSEGEGYVYMDISSTDNPTSHAGRDFGNVFDAPPAPDPYAHRIHNQQGRLLEQSRQTYRQDTSPPQVPPPPPPYEPASQRLQPTIGPPIPYNLALPSLDQADIIAPQPLRPTLPALVIPPPVAIPRTLVGPHLRGGARNEGYATLLEALNSLPPAPLAEQNEMVRQQYERYHQQQQYQLELQRQSQKQDSIMQAYQEQKLQHQRQILAQQALIQREQLAQLEYMQHQHQIHLLKSLHTHVVQQVEAQRRSGRESVPTPNHSPTEDGDEDAGFNAYTSCVDDESDAASNTCDDDQEEDDYPSVPILSLGYEDDHDVSYIPAFVRSRSVDNSSSGHRPENLDPPQYTVSRNQPLFGDLTGLPPSPATTSSSASSASPLRTAMTNARNGFENHEHRDTVGHNTAAHDADDDAILYN